MLTAKQTAAKTDRAERNVPITRNFRNWRTTLRSLVIGGLLSAILPLLLTGCATQGLGGATQSSGWIDAGTLVRLVTLTDKVGIGTNSPDEKLHVVGNLKLDGQLICTGCIDGTALSGATIGDITGVTAGTGLTGGGTSGALTLSVDLSAVQARVTGTCSAGNAIRVINSDGTVTCEAVAGSGAWSLNGNAGTNPATNFVGTTDAQPLVFRTVDTEVARFNTSGDFGIGTNNPDDALDVVGDADVSGILEAGSNNVQLTNAQGQILNAALVAPNAYAILQGHKTTIISLLTDSEVFEFVLPANATLVAVQVYCTNIAATSSVDVRENGVSVLSAPVTPTSDSVVQGTITDSALASGNTVGVVVTTNLTGAITDLSVTLVLLFAHQP